MHHYSEPMHHYTRVEGVDARWKLSCLLATCGKQIANLCTIILGSQVWTPVGNYPVYWLPVITWGAEFQDGGGTARAWIADPNVYRGIPMLQ